MAKFQQQPHAENFQRRPCDINIDEGMPVEKSIRAAVLLLSASANRTTLMKEQHMQITPQLLPHRRPFPSNSFFSVGHPTS
jgi:hypothetical protein